jgi:hypothetical protein
MALCQPRVPVFHDTAVATWCSRFNKRSLTATIWPAFDCQRFPPNHGERGLHLMIVETIGRYHR